MQKQAKRAAAAAAAAAPELSGDKQASIIRMMHHRVSFEAYKH
jgi:hypothetical protein